MIPNTVSNLPHNGVPQVLRETVSQDGIRLPPILEYTEKETRWTIRAKGNIA